MGLLIVSYIQFNSKTRFLKIQYRQNTSPNLLNLIITGNVCNAGAGIACIKSNSIIKNNFINNNSTDLYWGGGIRCEQFGGIISNNIIINNQAGSGGGLELFWESNPIISNNIIKNNKATSMGGGIILYSSCSPIMNNNIICNNEASYGGGIFLHYDSDPTIVNNTISNNVANSGGGIYTRFHSHPTLINSILWNNVPQELYCSDGNGMNSVVISYSDVEGGKSGIVNGEIHWLNGNINQEPLFINSDNGDYHLSEYSPCVDAGDSTQIYNDIEDLMNLGYALYPSLGGLRNDIGAYGGPGAFGWLDTITTIIIKDEVIGIASQYVLEQNYPNPFNPTTTISYSIEKAGFVTLRIYDVLGKEVKTLVNEFHHSGEYQLKFDATEFSSGLYFYKLQVGTNYLEVKKMMLIR